MVRTAARRPTGPTAARSILELWRTSTGSARRTRTAATGRPGGCADRGRELGGGERRRDARAPPRARRRRPRPVLRPDRPRRRRRCVRPAGPRPAARRRPGSPGRRPWSRRGRGGPRPRAGRPVEAADVTGAVPARRRAPPATRWPTAGRSGPWPRGRTRGSRRWRPGRRWDHRWAPAASSGATRTMAPGTGRPTHTPSPRGPRRRQRVELAELDVGDREHLGHAVGRVGLGLGQQVEDRRAAAGPAPARRRSSAGVPTRGRRG